MGFLQSGWISESLLRLPSAWVWVLHHEALQTVLGDASLAKGKCVSQKVSGKQITEQLEKCGQSPR